MRSLTMILPPIHRVSARRFDVYLATEEELTTNRVIYRGSERLRVVHVFADEESWIAERASGASVRRGEGDHYDQPSPTSAKLDGAEYRPGSFRFFYGCDRI